MSELAEAEVLCTESLGASVQRLELPRFRTEPKPPEPEIKPPTAEEIDAIQAAAQQEGFARGREDGYKAGYDSGLQEAQARATQLATTLDYLAAPLAGLDAAAEAALIELSVDIAQRIVGRELALAPDIVTTVVRDAVAALEQHAADALKVHLHPQDAELLRDAEAAAPWTIVVDDKLSPGGCRVSCRHGEIDACLETRFAEALRALREADR